MATLSFCFVFHEFWFTNGACFRRFFPTLSQGVLLCGNTLFVSGHLLITGYALGCLLFLFKQIQGCGSNRFPKHFLEGQFTKSKWKLGAKTGLWCPAILWAARVLQWWEQQVTFFSLPLRRLGINEKVHLLAELVIFWTPIVLGIGGCNCPPLTRNAL